MIRAYTSRQGETHNRSMPFYGMASFAFVVRFRAIREPPHFCRMRAKPTPLYFRGIFRGRFSSKRKMGGLHLHPPIDHSGRQRRPQKRYMHLILSIFRWVAQCPSADNNGLQPQNSPTHNRFTGGCMS